MESPIPSSENSPLLPSTAAARDNDGQISTRKRFAVAIPYLIVFLAYEIALTLVAIPMSPIQEGILCRKHYPDALNDNDIRCKDEVVQSEFSMIKGWEVTFGLLPGMLTAVPYGMAADKYGRKLVLGLSLVGLTLSQGVDIIVCRFPDVFPLQLIWLGATLTIIGGGPFVTIAMLFTIATDVSTEAQRSTTFLYLSAISLVAQLIAAPITYAAMSAGNWLAVFIGFGSIIASTLAIFFTPETSGLRPRDSVEEDNQGSDSGGVPSPTKGPWARIASLLRKQATSVQSLFWENKQVNLLLLTFLFTSIGKNIPLLLMQYITKRFYWSWAEAGLLNSVIAAVNLVTVALILPLASQILLINLQLSPLLKDLWLARAGIVALVVGTLGVGLAPSSAMLIMSLVIYSLGYGYGPAMRGLVVTLAQGRHTGMLFTSMSVLESIGLLISGPLLAVVFKLGMVWGNFWIGLPFISMGCCLACAAAIVIGLRVDQGKSAQADTE